MKLLKKEFNKNHYSAFILCGGLGSRLIKDGINLNKCLIKYKSKTLLEHHLTNLHKINIKKCFINILKKEKKFYQIKKKWSNKIKIKIFKDKKPLGTFGAISKRKKYLTKNIIVIYGDNYIKTDYKKFLSIFEKNNYKFVIGSYKKKNLSNSGRLISKKNILKKIEEKKIKNKHIKDFTNAGIYILKKNLISLYKYKKMDFAYNIIPDLIKKKEKIFIYKKITKCISFDTKNLLKKNKII